MKLYIDVLKALNTAKLVKKEVQVHGHNGKMFTRMQWVDPNTGLPVHEDSHPDHEDHHAKHVSTLNSMQRRDVARSYMLNDEARAHKFAYHTHIPLHSEGSHTGTLSHIANNLHKVPVSQVHHLMPPPEPVKETHVRPNPAPLGLKHTDHGLPETVVKHRHGEYGPLDLSKFHSGTKISDTDRGSNELNMTNMILNNAYNRRHMGGKNAEAKEHFENIFGTTTLSGLEHVFSVPELGIKCHFHTIQVNPGDEAHTKGKMMIGISMELQDKDGMTAGNMTRTFHRDENGHLNVENGYFDLHSDHQGTGLGKKIYARQEQFYRQLSHGHPVHITVCANISVGKYAWALSGFKFKNDRTTLNVQNDLRDFCKANKVDLKDILTINKFDTLDDIQHPWEFASLKDDTEWDLSYDPKGFYADEAKTRGGLKGYGHFGKAFLLAGTDYWDGKRTINNDSLEEQVFDPLKNYVK